MRAKKMNVAISSILWCLFALPFCQASVWLERSYKNPLKYFIGQNTSGIRHQEGYPIKVAGATGHIYSFGLARSLTEVAQSLRELDPQVYIQDKSKIYFGFRAEGILYIVQGESNEYMTSQWHWLTLVIDFKKEPDKQPYFLELGPWKIDSLGRLHFGG